MQLTRLQPGEPAHWLNLGNASLDCGDAEQAHAAFLRAGELGASGVPLLLGLGLAHLGCGRLLQAQALLSQAWRQEPQAADTSLAWAQCLAGLERFGEIAPCIGHLRPASLAPGQRRALAWLFAQAGEDERALALYRQVLDEAPQAVEPRLQLALLLERRNQVERAARLLEEAPVATAPLDAMKALALGRVMRRQGRHAEAAQVLAEGAGRGDSCEMGAQLRFEQAKALDAAGDVDAVMAALAHAHQLAGVALARRHPDPASQASLAWLDQVLGGPAPATWQAPRSDGLPADPWFLVGVLRSGTTLLKPSSPPIPASRCWTSDRRWRK